MNKQDESSYPESTLYECSGCFKNWYLPLKATIVRLAKLENDFDYQGRGRVVVTQGHPNQFDTYFEVRGSVPTHMFVSPEVWDSIDLGEVFFFES